MTNVFEVCLLGNSIFDRFMVWGIYKTLSGNAGFQAGRIYF